MKLNERIAFQIILQYNLWERINTVKDKFASFVYLLLAHWYLVDDIRKAHGCLEGVNENIIPFRNMSK